MFTFQMGTSNDSVHARPTLLLMLSELVSVPLSQKNPSEIFAPTCTI